MKTRSPRAFPFGRTFKIIAVLLRFRRKIDVTALSARISHTLLQKLPKRYSWDLVCKCCRCIIINFTKYTRYYRFNIMHYGDCTGDKRKMQDTRRRTNFFFFFKWSKIIFFLNAEPITLAIATDRIIGVRVKIRIRRILNFFVARSHLLIPIHIHACSRLGIVTGRREFVFFEFYERCTSSFSINRERFSSLVDSKPTRFIFERFQFRGFFSAKNSSRANFSGQPDRLEILLSTQSERSTRYEKKKNKK